MGRNRADKLVEVTLKAGDKRLLNIHIEVQSQKDASFERRMFTYYYRIFDKYGEPPLSLVVLADMNARWQPSCFEQKQITNQLNFSFARVKLLHYEPQLEQLTSSNNAFALLTAAHLITKRTKKNPVARKDSKLTLVKLLYKNDWDKDKVVNFFAILDWLMHLPPIEALKFNQELAQLDEERKMQYITSVERIGMQKGLQQGLEQGLVQGKTQGFEEGIKKAVLNLKNNLGFTAEKIAEVMEVPLDKIKQILNQTKH